MCENQEAVVARRPAALWAGLTVLLVAAFGLVAWGAFIALSPGTLSQPTVIALQDPATVGLQQGDLPASLSICSVSGGIDRYLQQLQASGSPSYEITQQQWASLQAKGATAASVQSYTTSGEDCQARLAERKGPSAISFAIRFRSAAGAVAGFRDGFLSLRPEPGMRQPGLLQGEATGLGATSWTFDQTQQSPSVFVSFWATRSFAVFFFAEQLGSSEARRAATGINQRIR